MATDIGTDLDNVGWATFESVTCMPGPLIKQLVILHLSNANLCLDSFLFQPQAVIATVLS